MKEIDNIFDIKDAEYIPKPDLLPYKKVVNKFKIIPHNTIMIDDIRANLVTAKKLGIRTVLVNKKSSQLIKNVIDYSFGDIASIIKKLITRIYLMKIDKLKNSINDIWKKKRTRKKNSLKKRC